MGLFRDSRDRRDLSLKVCWTLAVWLMTQQLRCDVNEADEAEQRRLERHPESAMQGQFLPQLGWRRMVNTWPQWLGACVACCWVANGECGGSDAVCHVRGAASHLERTPHVGCGGTDAVGNV